jgi:hypothetical protein
MRLVTLAGLVLLFAASGSTSARSSVGFRTPTLREAHAATVRTLRAERLWYRWVACVKTDHRFRGATIVRCNVNFGIDPHIVAYCTVLRGLVAVTQFENSSIPCGPDLSGPQFTITSGS